MHSGPDMLVTNSNECSICFHDMDSRSVKKPLIALRCDHLFHRHCIEEWELHDKSSQEGVSCPLCRRVYKAHLSFPSRIAAFFRKFLCATEAE